LVIIACLYLSLLLSNSIWVYYDLHINLVLVLAEIKPIDLVLNAMHVFLLLILILGVLLLLLALVNVLGLVVSAIVVGFEADLLDSTS